MFGGIQVVALGSGAFAGLQFAFKFLVLLLSEKRDGTAKKNKDGNQKATLTAETRRHGEDRVIGSSGHRVTEAGAFGKDHTAPGPLGELTYAFTSQKANFY